VSPAELLQLVQDFFRETLDFFNSRQKISQSVAGYDANNGYQQVIGRQEVHLEWLSDAISALGGTVDERATAEGDTTPSRGDARSLIEADVQRQQQFLGRWPSRVAGVTNARHRKMLELILGEMKEHLRILQHAAEGRSDVLGPHSDGKLLRGVVLPVRPKN
jgi:hypothetical protein